MSQNYYQLLHVLPDAPSPVIKASYRAMMQKMRHHPDLGGDPARAQRLNEAVDTLCNPDRRAIYDSKLQALSSQMKQDAAKQAAGDEGPLRKAQHASSGPGGNSDIPGGRPSGYEKRSKRPDKPADPEPDQGKQPTVPQVKLPTRPHCLFCKVSFSTTPRTHQHYQSDDQCHQCKAPAAPLEQLDTSTTEELRRIYRHDHHAAVRLWIRWPADNQVDARLQDLSLAGCAIESETELDGNALVLLDTDALKAICQVRYCKSVDDSAMFSIGLAFKTLKIKARPGTMISAVA